MKAGAASVDITPRGFEPIYLAGFGMGRRAKGVHLPLKASALALEGDGGGQVVLVSLDLVGLLKVWIDRIRAAVTELDGSAVIVACTHTHSGPDTLGYWGPSIAGVFPRSDGKNPNYMRWLVKRVSACVDQAVRAMRPATAKATTFEFDPKWCRNDRSYGGTYPDCVALALRDAEGGRICTVLNYASHPETLWEKNKLVSPDFVGPLRDHICESGGEFVYFSGPLGAMLTPNVPTDATPAQRMNYSNELGQSLAAATLSALEDADDLAGEVSHTRADALLSNDNWRYRLLERLHLVDVKTENGTVRTQVHHMSVGERFSLVTAPGELCPEAGAQVRSKLSTTHGMVVCLAEDEFGYLLQPPMFEDSEYGYEATMSLGRGTLGTLLDIVDGLARTEPDPTESDE